MTTPQYQRPLQTSLDDTIGSTVRGRVVFETLPAGQVSIAGEIGYARVAGAGGNKSPVYDGEGRVPDLGSLPKEERRIWVRAASVFSPGRKKVRTVADHEMFAIWDYEGKLESKSWPKGIVGKVLEARFASPPAKMIRTLLFTACEYISPFVHFGTPEEKVGTPGLTSEVPFSPLEMRANTRVKAAQADEPRWFCLSGQY